MAAVPLIDEIKRRHLGLPSHLLSTSGLTGEGIAEVTGELRLRPGDVLLDLACGRGGYGLEIAGRTGAKVTGVDFSPEAVRQARAQAERIGAGVEAEYRIGELTETGLPAASVSAVICIDSIQFADDLDAAYAEIRRVLAPGGRAVLTCWEAVDQRDETISVRLRRADLGAGLRGAGFTDVDVRERPAWRVRERGMWEAAAALDPGDDPALRSFHDEGVRSLRTWDALRRVLAVATAPVS
jgi:SAM-dependent methyltransferase